MALLFARHRRVASLDGAYGDYAGATASSLIPARPTSVQSGIPAVTSDTALRHSAVWACLRLRANLISTFPLDVFRRVGGVQVEVSKPPVIVNPGGERVDSLEWRYSTQIDLDRLGNAFGLITARSGSGLPARIDLVPASEASVRVDGETGELKYKFGRQTYTADEVWHERQYTVAGLPVGLSPLAYAAWTIAEYQSIQDFALTWFGGGGVPRGHLKNTMQTINPTQADAVKARFKTSVASGDVFVTGADWTYDMIQAEQTGQEWLEAKRYGVSDVARFFDVPGDLIDAALSGTAVTYANVTQRNLQFLTFHLGPTLIRRENALSRLLPRPQYVKFNTDALLRLDPVARAQQAAIQIGSRTLAPSEARELDNRQPFTPSQLHEFYELFGDPTAKAATAPISATPPTGGLS